jgi:rhodanese-related sulfurtransferase
MKNRFIKIVIPIFLLIGIVACSNLTEGDRSGAMAGPFNDVKELVHQAKKHVVETSPEDMKAIMDSKGDLYLIAVCEADEFIEGYIPGSINIPRGLIEFEISKESFWSDMGSVMPSKDYKIIVYCKTGGRSSLAAYSLQQLGYTDVASLHGGYKGWLKNYPDDVYPKVESKLITEVEETVQPVVEPIPEKKEIEVKKVKQAEEGC